MPYSETAQPSLALGLLKAVCDRQGLSSQVLYPNLWFSEEVGPAVYDLIYGAYSTTLIGEWTFGGALFPDDHRDHTEYVKNVVFLIERDARWQWQHILNRYPFVDFAELLFEVRRRTPDFVERVADHVLALKPKIVGCSSTFEQQCASLSLLRAIKTRQPEIITMIGGANCEGDMGRTAFEQFPWLDYVVSGEADGFFGTMCEKLLRGRVGGITPEELPDGVMGPHHRNGFATRKHQMQQGDVAAVAPARMISVANQELVAAGTGLAVLQSTPRGDGSAIARLEDMNESPVPNYDDYFTSLSNTQALSKWIRPSLPYQTARGCWWGEKSHCSFCGISRTAIKFRAKTADNVIEQLEAMRDRYKTTVFNGNEYIFDYRFFTSLLPRLKEFGAFFKFEVKANLRPDQLQAFIDAGVLEIQPGIESLHDEVLTLIRKGVNAVQNILLLKRARRLGLSISWNLLHHVPGDRDEWYGEMADFVPLLSHLQSPYGFSQIHYDRFSPYWRDPASYGLELLPAFGYEHVYPLPVEVLKDLAYFFETPWQREGSYSLYLDPVRDAGWLRLFNAVAEWRDARLSANGPPELTATNAGDRTEFKDTRPIAAEQHFAIEGLEHRMYWEAEDGVAPATLIKTLSQEDPETYSEGAIRGAISRLLDKKVVLNVSGRLLSLGIATPIPESPMSRARLPKAEVNPNWARLQADADLDEQRPSIVLSCVRPPDEPLSTWLA
jgi:magnesium-protoporphyrin IX monomethyl ester (oxidative) cyclase